jgi:hypothetical protein
VKRSIARTVAACAVLLAAGGTASHAPATAGSSVKTYRDTANHFTFQYPTSWALSTKLADISGVAASFGIRSGVAAAPADNAAYFAVLVKPSGTSLAAQRSADIALIKEGVTIVGAIHFKDMSAAFGGNALGAGANVRFDASHSGWVTVQAYVHNKKTYYNLQSELTTPAISGAENAQMKAVVTSYVSD